MRWGWPEWPTFDFSAPNCGIEPEAGPAAFFAVVERLGRLGTGGLRGLAEVLRVPDLDRSYSKG